MTTTDTLHKESMTNAATEPAAPTVAVDQRPGGLCVRAAELSAVREESREADFICSTDTRDSYGEIVRQTWDLSRFERNPVALWSHQSHMLPVGQWVNVRVDGGALRGTLRVASAAANPMAENVWQSIREKTIRAVSVGFMPGKVTVEDVDGKETVCLDENVLFEISPTPLPANPDAIVDQRRKAQEEYRSRIAGRGAPPILTLGAVPFEAYAATDDKWNVSATVRRLRDWASDGKGKDHVDWVKYRAAFAWVDQSKTHDYTGFRYPHHDVKDGKLITPRAGVTAACAAFARSNGGKMPDADRAAVKSHLQREAHACGLTAPWESKSAGTLTNNGATGAQEPSVDPKKQKDMDDEAKKLAAKAMVTCPECGEKFDPEDDSDDEKSKHAATFRSYVERKMAPIVLQLKAKVLDLTTERDAATTKHSTALTDLTASRAANDALALKLVETELKPLSGVKFAPASYDGIVDLAKHYLSQGDVGAVKWQKHLDGIRGGTDLTLLGGSVLPKDQTPSGIQSKGADDDDIASINAAART